MIRKIEYTEKAVIATVQFDIEPFISPLNPSYS